MGQGFRAFLVALVLLLTLTACGDRAARNNVRPPAPGTPARPTDVSGIYRTTRQSLLQLRADGEFVLVPPEAPGPSAGRFTLANGEFTVQTDKCGDAIGQYRLQVGGEQEAGKATLNFTPVEDQCAARLRHLTLDPWVYADS